MKVEISLGFLWVLSLALGVLKTLGYIHISWLVVLLPAAVGITIPFALGLLFIILLLLDRSWEIK